MRERTRADNPPSKMEGVSWAAVSACMRGSRKVRVWEGGREGGREGRREDTCMRLHINQFGKEERQEIRLEKKEKTLHR